MKLLYAFLFTVMLWDFSFAGLRRETTPTGPVSSPVSYESQNFRSTTSLTAPASVTLCPGQTATLVASGCTNYTWSPSIGLNTTNGSVVIANPPITTIYTITASGCGAPSTSTVMVTRRSIPSIGDIKGPKAICVNGSGITYSVSNVPSAAYSWTVPPGASITSGSNSNIITVTFGTNAGTITVSASNPCGVTTTTLLTHLATQLSLSVSPTSPSICPGSVAVMNVSGASNYTWSPNIGLSGTGNYATVASSPNTTTTYTVLGSSAACTGSTTVTVSVGSNLSIELGPTSMSICPNQTVTLNAIGPASSYTWSPSGSLSSANGSTVNAFPATTTVYTVSGSDNNGCAGTNTLQVYVNSMANASAGPSRTITCSAPSVTLSGSGGNGYAWSGPGIVSGANSANPVVDQPGIYNVTIMAATGCTAAGVATVSIDNTPPSLTVPPSYTLSCPTPTALLVATASPSSLTYTWSGSGTIGSVSASSVQVNAPGIYTVDVRNPQNGCVSTATTEVHNGPGVPTVTITATSSNSVITCANPVVELTAYAQPAGSLGYAWSTGATTNTISVSNPGPVTLTVTNTASNCAVSANYAIASNTTAPTFTVSNTVIVCGASTTTLMVSPPFITYTYAWTGPSPGSIIGSTNSSDAEVNTGGNYTVTVTDQSNGCVTTSVVAVTRVGVNAAFTANPLTGTAPLNVNFTNQSQGATSYTWTFGNGNSSSLINPSQTFGSNGTYQVRLVGTDGSCNDTAYVTIIVRDALMVEIPNVFTPNDDNRNDLFYLTTFGVETIDMKIYDRWGKKVYDESGKNPAWDGKTGGDAVPNGVYMYVVRITAEDGTVLNKQGNIHLFR